MRTKIPLLLTFVGALVPAAPVAAQPPQAGFGFNGSVSGFPTGAVTVTGGGAYALPDFVHSAGGFSCIADVLQGPLSIPLHGGSPCVAGQGVRWDGGTAAQHDFQVHCDRYGKNRYYQ